MTDSEINLAIAKIEYPNEPDRNLTEHNYCTNWSDIGPIIEREGLALMTCRDGMYQASKWVGSLLETAYGDTPTKAAALLYLKMKGET